MIFIALVILVIVLALLYYLFPLITVCGDSMFPTYHDGEIILGTRVYRKKHLKVGDVVLFYPPYDNDGERVVIKRISDVNVEGNRMFCLGDNPPESYDSRAYGYVSLDSLVCKVVRQRKQKVR